MLHTLVPAHNLKPITWIIAGAAEALMALGGEPATAAPACAAAPAAPAAAAAAAAAAGAGAAAAGAVAESSKGEALRCAHYR